MRRACYRLGKRRSETPPFAGGDSENPAPCEVDISWAVEYPGVTLLPLAWLDRHVKRAKVSCNALLADCEANMPWRHVTCHTSPNSAENVIHLPACGLRGSRMAVLRRECTFENTTYTGVPRVDRQLERLLTELQVSDPWASVQCNWCASACLSHRNRTSNHVPRGLL